MEKKMRKIKNSVLDNVLKKIETGEVKMKPRWYFVLRGILFLMLIIIGLLMTLYLVSFVLFVLHYTGVWFMPVFGIKGIKVYLLSIPWMLVVVGLFFIVLLEFMVKQYAFAYKRPLIYSLLGILVLILFGSFFVFRAGFHQDFFRRAYENKLLFASHMYRQFGLRKFRDIHRGIIKEIRDEGFIIENYLGENLLVIVSSETRLPSGIIFDIGDNVVVLGERDDSVVKAFGVRKIGDELFFDKPFLRKKSHFFMPPMRLK